MATMSLGPIQRKMARLFTLFSLSLISARNGPLSSGYGFDIRNRAGQQWFRGTRCQCDPYESRHRAIDFDHDQIGWRVHILTGEGRALLCVGGNDRF